jgi:hypothetical protein
MVEGGELRAQRWCESKPLMMAPRLCAYIMKNLGAMSGHPLGINPLPDFKERSIKKKGGGWNLDLLHK